MAAGQDSDEVLMDRVKRGDHAAFALLVRLHSKMFFAAAWRMCSNTQEAEDIVQEAFLKLWNRPEAFDAARGAKFTTWFYRVVTNLAIDRKRRERRHESSDILPLLPDRSPGADDKLQAEEQASLLENAIAALPERQKAALNLCFYEGLSNRQAAEVLGIGVKALESLLMRAKAAIREHFPKDGIGEGLAGHGAYKKRRSNG